MTRIPGLSPPLLAVLALSSVLSAQVSVLTEHYDNNRTGENQQEIWLNTSNVNVSNFGKLFVLPVDGNIYAQPLYVANLVIAGVERNVLYVATEHNTIYAFDADDPSGVILWHKTLGTTVPSQDVCAASGCVYQDIVPEIGITSTPVIDKNKQTIYVLAKNKDSDNTYHYRLHALNILSGAELPGSPVDVTASGFNVLYHLSHPALLLANGKLYLGFGSLGDTSPWHGWLMTYDATTLQQKAVFNASAGSSEDSIWQGGQGPAVDAAGNVYVGTANGPFNVNTGGSAYGDSILKLDGSSLSVLDYFTPDDQSSLSAGDTDLGTGGPILLPGTNLLVSGGKDGWIRVMDTGNMGKFNATFNADFQEWQATSGQIIGAPVYWTNSTVGPLLYLYGAGDLPKAFRFNGTTFQTTAVSVGTIRNTSGDANNAALAVSSNGETSGSGILWSSGTASGDPSHSPMPGIMRAFDAADLANELWDSNQNSSRDAVGNYAKYVSPVVANGKVYLATVSGRLVVYGLLAPPAFTLQAAPATVAVVAGGSASYNVSVSTQNGFSQPVTLSCLGMPPGYSCSFNPASVTPTSGTVQASATVVVPPGAAASDQTITVNGTAGALHGSVPVTVSVKSFDLSVAPKTATVSAGSAATYQLTVTPQNGFSSAIGLSCSGPANAGISCAIESSVTPGAAPALVTLTVTTAGQAAVLRHLHPFSPLYSLVLLLPAAFLGGGYHKRRSRLLVRVGSLLTLVVLALLLANCGGGSSAAGPAVTPSGAYTITVNASSGALTRTTSVALTVQ